MEQQAVIANFEKRAKALDISIAAVCERAGIHRTSFSRWKLSEKNPKPIGMTLESYNAMNTALAEFEGARIIA